MIAIGVLVAATLAQTPGPTAQVLSCAGLRLPDTLRAVAVGYRNDDPEPLHQFEVVETAHSVWARQDIAEGSAGFVASALTIVDATSTLLYDIRTRRGSRDNRFIDNGTTRIDGLVTPMAWVRRLEFARAHGDAISQRSGDAGEVIVSVQAPRISGRSFEATIDPSTQQLSLVTCGEGDEAVIYRYEDWRELGNNLQAPFITSNHLPGHGKVPPMELRFLLGSAQAESGGPPAFAFPAHAVIEDVRSNTLTDGTGKVIELTPAPPSAPVAVAKLARDMGWFTPTRLMVIGGGLLIAIAIAVKVFRAVRA